MLRSMTGFAIGETKFSQGSIVVEIQSVNKRFLDLFVNTPDELFFLQTEIRKKIQESIFRGQIYVKITFKFAKQNSARIFAARSLKELKAHLEKLAKSLGYLKNEISFPFLLENYLSIQKEKTDVDVANIKNLVEKALSDAIENLIVMKEKEGKELHKALEKMIENIDAAVILIGKRAPVVLKANQKKAKEKAKKFIPENVEESEKILRSIGTLAKFFAEKGEITEEIVRLKTHLKHFANILREVEKNAGKQLEFLAQEMQRETNTISAKSTDMQILTSGLLIKNEIEKIKEQLQNIE